MTLLRCALIGLSVAFLSACGSTPDATMPTEPAPTAENPWLPGLNGAALHSPSDGLCPARLGTFDRTEYSTIALNGLNGGERFDGICRYGNSDIGASITTYFYLTEGLSQTDEMRASVASIEDSRDARITQLPTSTCAGSISAVRPNPGANCIVLENESGSMREYVTMLTRNDWFTKLRASVPTADEDAMRITLAAIMEFNANQP